MKTMPFDLPRHTSNVSLIAATQHDLKGTGRYFATMVIEGRQEILSVITQGGFARWTDVGKIVNCEIQALTTKWPIEIDRLAIMPDHIHLCFRVTAPLEKSIIKILSDCRNFSQKVAGFNCTTQRLWERRYRLFVAFNRECYSRCVEYTGANPLRWWLAHHQTQPLTPHVVKHSLLPETFSWQAVGRLSLLETPLIFPIIVHRKDSPAQIEQYFSDALRVAQNGGAIIGGFISQAEKSLLKRLYVKVPHLKLIRLVPHTLSDYKPPARTVDAFAQGLRLLLTSVPDISSSETCSRTICLRHNAIAEQISSASKGLYLPSNARV